MRLVGLVKEPELRYFFHLLESLRAVIPDGKEDRVAVQPGQSQIKTV
jgi:hypothetical protein